MRRRSALTRASSRAGWDLSRIPAADRTSAEARALICALIACSCAYFSPKQMLAGASNPLLTLFRLTAAHEPLARTAKTAAIEARFDWRTSLCAYFAWAVPNEAALAALVALGSLLELGAGTGYWAHLLRKAGADVAAYDAAGSHEGQGFRFRCSSVRDGGPEAAAEAAGRALLLCWPDIVGDSAADDADRGDFGTDCVRAFRGDVIAHIGELGPAVARARAGYGDVFPPGGSSSSAALQAALREGFTCERTVKLPNWPPYNSHLTIWRRKASQPKGAAAMPSVPRAPRACRAIDAEWLLAPNGLAAFLATSCGREPLLLRADAGRSGAIADVAPLGALLSGGDDVALRWGRDVCASRYSAGTRENHEPPGRDAPAPETQLRALLAAGYTLQVHQPQRWSFPLWHLCASLEAALGALVGANAYITPPGCQGLAPHHDDVDVWVLHTAGAKSWRVYPTPQGSNARPRNHSADMPRHELPPPAMEVTLRPGDVLYLPRGTPHEAIADKSASKGTKGEASCHITLSSFQRWDAGDLASHALTWLLDAAEPGSAAYAAAAPLRAPLAPGIALRSAPAEAAATAAAALRAAADALDAHAAAAGGGALDALAADFMAARLPPAPLLDRGPLPSARDSLAAAAPGCARLAVAPDGRAVALVSCLANDRRTHMVGSDSESESSDEEDEGEEEDEEGEEAEDEEASGSRSESGDEDGAQLFPVEYADALRAALAAEAPPGIPVAALPLPGPPAARLALARALWAAGLVRTLPAAADAVDTDAEPARKKGKK
jgi:lysine-specific demethylase/histidyl-hydroxylase NO66